MEFAHPTLLAGLAGALVPLAIHLIRRRFQRRTSWAALAFLQAAERRARRRLQLAELLLLAVRAAAVVALALALALPTLPAERLGASFERPGRRRIIIFDNTFSLGLKTGGQAAIERAREAAAGLVADLGPGDQAALVTVAGAPRLFLAPTADLDLARREARQVPLSDDGGSVVRTVAFAAAELLPEAGAQTPQLFVLSDLQRQAWETSEAGMDWGLVRSRLAAAGAAVFLVPLGEPAAQNTALTTLAPAEALTLAGGEAQLTVGVTHFGPRPRETVTVRLAVDGRRRPDLVFGELLPGREVCLPLALRLPEAGDHLVEAWLPDDDLPLDDRRALALEAAGPRPALLVDGDPHPEIELGDETDYLVRLLAAGGDAQPPCRARVVAPADLPGALAPETALVVLANVRAPTPETAAALEAFVRGGGGLLFCGGANVDAAAWNELCFRDGQGPLPARLGAARQAGGGGLFLRARAEEHEVLSWFRGREEVSLALPRFSAYLAADRLPAAGAEVLAEFSDGAPALVARRYGQGVAALFAASADLEWTDLPVRQEGAILFRRLAAWLAADRQGERTGPVGAVLQALLPLGAAPATLRLAPPGGEAPLALAPLPAGERLAARLEDTGRAGAYVISWGEPGAAGGPIYLAVQPPAAESNLAALTVAETRALFGEEVAFAEISPRRIAAAGGPAPRAALGRALLVAFLGLLLLETALAGWGRFGR